MSAAEKSNVIYTVQEYMLLEQKSEERHDFHHGQLYLLAGTSKQHNRITKRIWRILDSMLESSACEVFSENVKMEVQHLKTYVYPDIVVSCDPEDEDEYLVKKPVIIIEVLSNSNQDYDRGFKLTNYLKLPALQQYLLVSQNEVLIECYTRDADFWRYDFYTNPEEFIPLNAIGGELSVGDVFRGLVAV